MQPQAVGLFAKVVVVHLERQGRGLLTFVSVVPSVGHKGL